MTYCFAKLLGILYWRANHLYETTCESPITNADIQRLLITSLPCELQTCLQVFNQSAKVLQQCICCAVHDRVALSTLHCT